MAVNPTIIKQNVDEWFEIMKELGYHELSHDEQTIIEYLKDYWRNVNNVGDDDGQCQSYLEQLKGFKNKHINDREVVALSNKLCGIADKMFLKDNDTYHEFQKQAREYVKQHKPQAPKPQHPKPQQQPPPLSQPKPQQPKPRVNMAIVKVNVQDWCESMRKLAYSNISDDELTLIDWLWNYPLNYSNIGEDNGQCRTCIEMIKDFKNKHAKDPEVVTLSNKLRGIAEKMFLTDNDTYQAFRRQLQQTLQSDSDIVLSPNDLRVNAEASHELEREIEELWRSDNTPKPQPKPTPPNRPPTPTQKPTTTPKPTMTFRPDAVTSPTTTVKSGSNGGWGFGCLIIIIAAVLYFGGWNWIKERFSGGDEEKPNVVNMYVLVESLNLRSTPDSSAPVLATLGYGQDLYTNNQATKGWTRVSVNGQEGYVASTYIGTNDELMALQDIWGDDATRQAVTDISYRRALIEFIRWSKGSTDFRKFGGYTLYASGKNSGNVWQHKSLGGYGVFAFILEHKGSSGRTAAICTFNSQDEPNISLVNDKVASSQIIKKVSYQRGKYELVFRSKTKERPKEKGRTVQPDENPTQTTDPSGSGYHFEKQQSGTGYHFERLE